MSWDNIQNFDTYDEDGDADMTRPVESPRTPYERAKVREAGRSTARNRAQYFPFAAPEPEDPYNRQPSPPPVYARERPSRVYNQSFQSSSRDRTRHRARVAEAKRVREERERKMRAQEARETREWTQRQAAEKARRERAEGKSEEDEVEVADENKQKSCRGRIRRYGFGKSQTKAKAFLHPQNRDGLPDEDKHAIKGVWDQVNECTGANFVVDNKNAFQRFGLTREEQEEIGRPADNMGSVRNILEWWRSDDYRERAAEGRRRGDWS